MGKKEHLVWQYFSKKKEGNKKFGFCKFCNIKYVNHATRMLKHLRTCKKCPEEVRNIFNKEISKKNNKTKEFINLTNTSPSTANVDQSNEDCCMSEAQASSFCSSTSRQISTFIDTCNDQQKGLLDEALARAIFSSTTPLSFVDNQYFKQFLKLIRPAYNPPSRFLLSNDLLEKEYTLINECIQNKLNEAESITLLSDGWTDTNGISLLNIIMATPKPIFIKCIDSKTERHTAEYLFSVFDSFISENSKICEVCTDNTNTNKAAWRLLEEKYPHLTTYGCAAHCINLLAKDLCSLDTISNTCNSGKTIVKFFKNKSICKQTLKKIQIDQIGKEIGLDIACETRWSSTYKSLKSLLANKEFIQAAVFDKNLQKIPELTKIKNFVLDSQFWDKVYHSCKILEPLAAAINFLEGDNYCTISHVFPLYFEIEEAIHKHKTFLTQAEQQKIMEITSHREVFLLKTVHKAAYLLHPKLKGEKLNDTQFLEATQFVAKIGLSMGFQEEDILNELLNFNGKIDFWQNGVLWTAAEKCNPIAWWKGMCRNKQLSAIASRILNFPATAASCERNWKDFSSIKTKKRNKLTVERTQKLVSVKYNLNLLSLDDLRKRPRRDFKKVDSIYQHSEESLEKVNETKSNDESDSSIEISEEEYDTEDLINDASSDNYFEDDALSDNRNNGYGVENVDVNDHNKIDNLESEGENVKVTSGEINLQDLDNDNIEVIYVEDNEFYQDN